MRLAVAQAPASLPDTQARLDWLANALPAIAAAGADLVLLPELFACGYNIGDALRTRAEPASGAIFMAMSELASRFGLAIHYGFVECANVKIYNSANCVSASRGALCHQRKLAIPPGFERQHFNPGQGCQLFEMCGLKIATLICYDAEFPETVRHVAALGADLVLVPTALGSNWPWVAQTMIPARAYENGIYLAYANSAGVENGMEFLGSSVIVAPDGEEVARAGSLPDVIYADIEADRVKRAQARLPYLHDSSKLRLD